jgi:hypothetical protein
MATDLDTHDHRLASLEDSEDKIQSVVMFGEANRRNGEEMNRLNGTRAPVQKELGNIASRVADLEPMEAVSAT